MLTLFISIAICIKSSYPFRWSPSYFYVKCCYTGRVRQQQYRRTTRFRAWSPKWRVALPDGKSAFSSQQIRQTQTHSQLWTGSVGKGSRRHLVVPFLTLGEMNEILHRNVFRKKSHTVHIEKLVKCIPRYMLSDQLYWFWWSQFIFSHNLYFFCNEVITDVKSKDFPIWVLF